MNDVRTAPQAVARQLLFNGDCYIFPRYIDRNGQSARRSVATMRGIAYRGGKKAGFHVKTRLQPDGSIYVRATGGPTVHTYGVFRYPDERP